VIGALMALTLVAVVATALVLLASTTAVVIVAAAWASFGSRTADEPHPAQPVE
jgi:hypothetical protein